jgi:hypothetical protein
MGMKKAFLGIVLVAMFVSTALFASVPINKKHKGKELNGAKVNCVYCHKTAGIAKEGGQDNKALQKKATCKSAGCH